MNHLRGLPGRSENRVIENLETQNSRPNQEKDGSAGDTLETGNNPYPHAADPTGRGYEDSMAFRPVTRSPES